MNSWLASNPLLGVFHYQSRKAVEVTETVLIWFAGVLQRAFYWITAI